MSADRRQIGLRTATLLVIASMIGTGVFTTTGFLWADTPSVPFVLGAWVLGGALALFGALNYAELTAALPRNGGEYQLLSRIYHPAVGFVCGWAAFIAGFAAPVGGTAMAFGQYLERVFPGLPPTTSATLLILGVAIIHSYRVKGGTQFQDLFTFGKAALITGFVIAGAWAILAAPSSDITPAVEPASARTFSLPTLGTGLIFVSYSYLGWNAACYIAGEVKSPGRNIPRALFLGTGCVTLLYLGLNAVFLFAGDPDQLAGELEIADIVARTLWGPTAAKAISAIIAIGLISTVGALTVTGPRIYEAIGEDFPKLSLLSFRPQGGGPVVGIALQTCVALITVYTATYDQVLIYVGITLSLFGVLTVAGVTVLRLREPDLPRPYRAWGQPWTGIIYSALMVGMVVLTVMDKPYASLAAAGTLALGFVIFLIVQDRKERE